MVPLIESESTRMFEDVRGELMPLSTLTLFATVQPEDPVVPSRLIPAVTFP